MKPEGGTSGHAHMNVKEQMHVNSAGNTRWYEYEYEYEYDYDYDYDYKYDYE